MSLQAQIELALKEAIRERSETKRNAIRLLLTALKVKEKEIRRELNEAEIQQVIGSQIKQRRESEEQYRLAGRPDLAGTEQEEARVLQAFLPEALAVEVLEAMIDQVIAEVGANSERDIGKVMKALMPKVGGRAEGRQVNELVRRKLLA